MSSTCFSDECPICLYTIAVDCLRVSPSCAILCFAIHAGSCQCPLSILLVEVCMMTVGHWWSFPASKRYMLQFVLFVQNLFRNIKSILCFLYVLVYVFVFQDAAIFKFPASGWLWAIPGVFWSFCYTKTCSADCLGLNLWYSSFLRSLFVTLLASVVAKERIGSQARFLQAHTRTRGGEVVYRFFHWVL